jgi:hypothetical protein
MLCHAVTAIEMIDRKSSPEVSGHPKLSCSFSVLKNLPIQHPSPNFRRAACVLTAILAIALPAEIIASVVDSRTGQFPVDGFLGPVVALVMILAVLNCVCACILCCKARSNSDFDDAYSPRIIDRVCCCGCFSRGPCCRSRRDEGAPIVVMHAPGLPAMNV